MGVTTLAVDVANPAKPEVRQLGLALDPIRRQLKPVTLFM